MPHFLIQDPHHPYAVHLIDLIHRRYGYRPICFYTDARRRAYCEARYPQLKSNVIAASHTVHPADLRRFVDVMRKQFSIVGVVPYSEETVACAGEIAAQLRLNWNDVTVIRRFRNKHALKAMLRLTRPDIRMNASFPVRSWDDLIHTEPLPERFVLKPNDGYGNRAVGFFERSVRKETVEAFFAAHPNTQTWVCEERIDGPEYFVNGQMDARGKATVSAIFKYVRTVANGRENLDWLTMQVHRAEPVFTQLERYAVAVMEASWLKRSPFHMEIKVDDRGPCLIEVGARLVGNGNAFACNALHGGKLDLFDQAAHHYFSSEPYTASRPDWDTYEKTNMLYVHGVSRRSEIIYQLVGVKEVEALPAFHSWVKQPELGQVLQPTRDALTPPYALILANQGNMDELVDTSAHVRKMIRWNHNVSIKTMLEVGFDVYRKKAEERLRWMLSGPSSLVQNVHMR